MENWNETMARNVSGERELTWRYLTSKLLTETGNRLAPCKRTKFR